MALSIRRTRIQNVERVAPEPFFEALGRRIAHLRRAAGISRSEAAQALGIHPDTLSRYERGRLPIPLPRLLALADRFATEPADLLPPRRADAATPQSRTPSSKRRRP